MGGGLDDVATGVAVVAEGEWAFGFAGGMAGQIALYVCLGPLQCFEFGSGGCFGDPSGAVSPL